MKRKEMKLHLENVNRLMESVRVKKIARLSADLTRYKLQDKEANVIRAVDQALSMLSGRQQLDSPLEVTYIGTSHGRGGINVEFDVKVKNIHDIDEDDLEDMVFDAFGRQERYLDNKDFTFEGPDEEDNGFIVGIVF